LDKASTACDGRLKVTGGARYAAEFKVPDAVYAVLVQSTIGAGAITSFDLAAAKSMPGVLAIITPENALKLRVEGHTPQAVHAPLLQDMDVHYNGQHVAVVVGGGYSGAGRCRRGESAHTVSARRACHLDGCGARSGLSAEELSQR
jgi:xanthine dehydrogenase YagR molybdenum-binding subunit